MFESDDDPFWEGSKETWMCEEKEAAGIDVLAGLRNSIHVHLDRWERLAVAMICQFGADEFNTSYHASSMEGDYLEMSQRIQDDLIKKMREIEPDAGIPMNATELDFLCRGANGIRDESGFEVLHYNEDKMASICRELASKGGISVMEFYC